MNDKKCLVIALDDERSILTSLERLLPEHGYPVRTHRDPDEFFRAGLPPDIPACLLLDQQLDNGVTGVEVHAEMQRRNWKLPTIFLTAHGNVPLVVRAMRAGADGFLTKPYEPEHLLLEINRAIAHSRSLLEEEEKLVSLCRKAASLTPREKEVVSLVVDGLINKEIADRLNLAQVTVKLHRGNAMRKFGAGNPAELCKLAIQSGLVKPQ